MCYFHFTPGHAGVKGNERTDCLTSTVIIAGDRAMDQAALLFSALNLKAHKHELCINGIADLLKLC